MNKLTTSNHDEAALIAEVKRGVRHPATVCKKAAYTVLAAHHFVAERQTVKEGGSASPYIFSTGTWISVTFDSSSRLAGCDRWRNSSRAGPAWWYPLASIQ